MSSIAHFTYGCLFLSKTNSCDGISSATGCSEMGINVKKLWNTMKQSKVFRSLRIRIFLILMLVGIIPGVIMHYGIMERYLDNAISVKSNEVVTQIKILADHLITYNYLLDSDNEVVNAELSQLSNLYDGRVLIIDNNLKIIKDTYDISEGKTILASDVVRCFKGEGSLTRKSENNYIMITVPIEERAQGIEQAKNTIVNTANNAKIVGAISISVSTDSIMSSYDYLNSRAIIIEMLVLVIVFAFLLYIFSIIPIRLLPS